MLSRSGFVNGIAYREHILGVDVFDDKEVDLANASIICVLHCLTFPSLEHFTELYHSDYQHKPLAPLIPTKSILRNVKVFLLS